MDYFFVIWKIFFTIVTFLACVLLYINWTLEYWHRKKVPHLPPTIPFGNIENPYRSGKSLGVQYKQLYDELKSHGWKYAGFYSFLTPTYFPLHPEYIKSVLIKDFGNFHARGFYSNEKDQPLGANLFNIDGVKWRKLRTKLTPSFTSGKIKNMFQIFEDCSAAMQNCVALSASEDKPVNIKHVAACYTTDIIGNCAFGLQLNSFENPEPILLEHVKCIFKDGVNLPRLAFCHAFPDVARFFKMVLFPDHTVNYFTGLIKNAVAYRNSKKFVRNDFLQLLINMMGDGLTVDEVAAQSFAFFLASHETSSTAITFCMYELAQHQHIQQKVRDEIHTVLTKYQGRVTYDALAEMKYLQQVLDETLRKYPIIPFINRKCTSNYTIPNTDVVIEKDTQVVISVLGIHRDPEFYPEPEKFDPDRFTDDLKHQHVYFPFGDGPRNCIGLRFGMLQTKLGLCMLVKDFVFSINSKTEIPLVLDTSVVLSSTKDIMLDVSLYKTNLPS